MKSERIINAKELLLLCVLRGKSVFAKNLSVYDWTIKHYSFVQENSKKILKSKKSLEKEAKEKFEVKEPEFRNFVARYGDFLTLSDLQGDMSWYLEGSYGKEFSYKGDFELSIFLSEEERAVLEIYCK